MDDKENSPKPPFDPRKDVLYYDHEDGDIHRVLPLNKDLNPMAAILGLLIGIEIITESLGKKLNTMMDLTPAHLGLINETAKELGIKPQMLSLLMAHYGQVASFMGVFAAKEGEHIFGLYAGIDPQFCADALEDMVERLEERIAAKKKDGN